MVRVYHAHPTRSGREHRTYGPLNRFDQHVRNRHQRPKVQLDGRGVIYLAENLDCALAEAFQDQGKVVGVCPNMRAVAMAPQTPAKLLDITGNGVMKIGAVASLAGGNEPRRLTQRWGRAIYEDLLNLAGILYRGAHQSGRCVVAWERTGALAFDRNEDRSLVSRVLWERVEFELAEQGRSALQIKAGECKTCQDAGLTNAISPV
jgi:RES domain-containing protein